MHIVAVIYMNYKSWLPFHVIFAAVYFIQHGLHWREWSYNGTLMQPLNNTEVGKFVYTTIEQNDYILCYNERF